MGGERERKRERDTSGEAKDIGQALQGQVAHSLISNRIVKNDRLLMDRRKCIRYIVIVLPQHKRVAVHIRLIAWKRNVLNWKDVRWGWCKNVSSEREREREDEKERTDHEHIGNLAMNFRLKAVRWHPYCGGFPHNDQEEEYAKHVCENQPVFDHLYLENDHHELRKC